MNRHILDTLNKKEEQQYSHIIASELARKKLKRLMCIRQEQIYEHEEKENELCRKQGQ